MSFNANNLILRTSLGSANDGMPGFFGYNASTDNLSTVLTNGYFPSSALTGWAGTGDIVAITASDGMALRSFDSSFNLVNPCIFLQSYSVNTITSSSGSLLADNFYIINNSTSGTYTLPDATTCSGEIVKIKKISGLLITVTINTVSSQTIDSASTLVMTSLNSSYSLISDGSNWWIT